MNMKKTEERAKYNFFDDNSTEKLLLTISKLKAKITTIAKLKI